MRRRAWDPTDGETRRPRDDDERRGDAARAAGGARALGWDRGDGWRASATRRMDALDPAIGRIVAPAGAAEDGDDDDEGGEGGTEDARAARDGRGRRERREPLGFYCFDATTSPSLSADVLGTT